MPSHRKRKDDSVSENDDYVQFTDEVAKKSSEFLASLNVKQKIEDLTQLQQVITSKSTRPKTHAKKNYDDEPRRRSMRLQNSPVKSLNEKEIQNQMIKEEQEQQEQQKVPKDIDVKLESCVREEYTHGSAVVHLELLVKKYNKKDISISHNEVMEKFNVVSSFSIAKVINKKVCQSRGYALGVHPRSDCLLFAAGDIRGDVGFSSFGNTLERCEFQPFSGRPVTSLVFDHDHLLASSYDGSVRTLDLHRSDLNFHLLYDNLDFGVTSISSNDADVICNDMWLSLDNGTVVRLDCRSDKENLVVGEYRVNKHSCKTVSSIPNNFIFCTASRDGTVAFFDSRMLKNDLDYLALPLAQFKHGGSVNSAFLHSADPSVVLSTSWDHTIQINKLKGSSVKTVHVFSHNNNTGRYLTPFKAVWHPSGAFAFGVGSLQRPRRLQLFGSNSADMSKFSAKELYHDELSSVQSLVAFHESLPLMISLNASGRVLEVHLE